ncbi:Wax synthase domain containing protein [Trema orientale]|uniref:Wax synthase domain containing protein n=1 Tax=Trema orientale TaxID=63057 RepID=A0A2P5EGY1_TREOI|nr:Wax synthase domain containing protein [Trema orientale]
MEGEMNNFIKVWISIFASLYYCYVISKLVSTGIKRLLCFLPIVCLFLVLPLKLNTINFGGGTAFFISWLANFKLLLLAFGKGPLASNSSISLGRFMVIACLPIEIRENPPPKSSNHENDTNPSSQNSHSSTRTGQNEENPSQKTTKQVPKRPLINFPVKALLLGILIRVFDYREHIHRNVVLVLYCFFIYLLLETILTIVATLARALVGLELEPQFNEPYLSTSLQDFWGRRWNLMVTRILRPTVYEPTLGFTSHLIGRKWSPLPAVIGTFLVSGLVHELIYYYMARVPPTWEVTSFFILHGLCLTVEIVLKKALNDTWRLPGLLSGPLTIGFVMLTSFWLFFPQFLRCEADVRLLKERSIVPTHRNLKTWTTLARAVVGVELEPQFNEPSVSTSLQDFWGKRWNLVVVSRTLRLSTYEPTLNL